MKRFVPGRAYRRQEVLSALKGAKKQGSWIFGRDVMAMMVEIGAQDDQPYFPTRSTLRWPGKVPERTTEPSRILVFARWGMKPFRFAGTASIGSYDASRRFPRDARFTLTPSLPRKYWLDSLGRRIPTIPTGPAPVTAIASLTGASTARDRQAALTTFLEGWYGKRLRTANVGSNARTPEMLRRLRGIVGTLPEATRFNHLLPTKKLTIQDGRIAFLAENQGVCVWATETEGEDPRVWYRVNAEDEPWIEEPERLSGFLIQAFLFEAAMNARFGAGTASLDPKRTEAILSRVEPLPLGQWNWNGTTFHAHEGALVLTMENEGAFDVHLAAMHPLALDRFEDLVDDRWDRVAF